jgi:tetrahydromethanopterin S-methyltransferase subunit B
MSDPAPPGSQETRGLLHARELEEHLRALDTFTPLALGILATASGIYTYLGVSSLLVDEGALSFIAAVAYSVAVSVAIFVFWSFLIRLLPAMRTAGSRLGLVLSMVLGSLAIVAMSSWLNAAALAGTAAVEQHLARTVQDYQSALEQSHATAIAGQSLALDVGRARQSFQDLSAQEATGGLSGTEGRGAVFRVLTQKADELAALEAQIAAQGPLVEAAFAEGNDILSRMRALAVASGSVDERSVQFSEESVRLAGLIAQLRQLSVAPLVDRAAQDLSASVVLPELDGRTADIRLSQESTIQSVMSVLDQRAETLRQAADAVLAMPAPAETTYTPISTADAVIRYAGDFVPSWAGAIAIDLLPAVLVLIMMVVQSAIRAGRDPLPLDERLTVAEMRAAVAALARLERPAPAPEPLPPATVEKLEPRKPREVPGP